MATWGLHLRIAEAVIDKGYDLDEAMFAVGNIGPDCGMPNVDWSAFDPPTEVSHWKNNDDRSIDAEGFYKKYLSVEVADYRKASFLLGYYVHLLTDIDFAKLIGKRKLHNPLYEPWQKDPKFIWTIKEDWYDLDHLYFRDHPESLFHRVFQHIKEVPNYLDYYPDGAIKRQVKYITEYYQNPSENLDRDYIYLSQEDMNLFLSTTEQHIAEDLDVKGWKR